MAVALALGIAVAGEAGAATVTDTFEIGSGTTFSAGTFRDCTSGIRQEGSCSLKLDPPCCSTYYPATSQVGVPIAGATTASFYINGETTSGNLDSDIHFVLDSGHRVVLHTTAGGTTGGNSGLSLLSASGQHNVFGGWHANTWTLITMTFQPATKTVTATMNGVSRTVTYPSGTALQRVEWYGVRWGSGTPIRYDSLRVQNSAIDNRAPTAELVSPADGTTIGTADWKQGTTYQVRATDLDGHRYTARFYMRNETTGETREFGPTGLTDSGAIAQVQTTLGAGRWKWKAQATDALGKVGDPTPERTITICAVDDLDCDDLTTSTENALGTAPDDADTDDDGLLDSWEAPETLPGTRTPTPGRGIRVSSTTVLTPEEVLGPYVKPGERCDAAKGRDALRRYTSSTKCLNLAPDPLRKDVYFELDWQDCSVGGCFKAHVPIRNLFPEAGAPSHRTASINLDSLHHAPSADGLQDVVNLFLGSPVPTTSETGKTLKRGVAFNVYVDENLRHAPNCVGPDYAKPNFGTKEQRDTSSDRRVAALAKKRELVRYVFSGHSTADAADHGGHSHDVGGDPCPLPGPLQIGFSGLSSLVDLPWYDNSPIGMVAQGGDLVVMSVGPLWVCGSHDAEETVLSDLGDLGPCFREAVGIYPAEIENKYHRHPIHLLLGESEQGAIRQIWARGLARQVGIALGLTPDQARNQPVPLPMRTQNQQTHDVLDPLYPDGYETWTHLKYELYAAWDDIGPQPAPFTHREQLPDYDAISGQDPDGDGRISRDDNCPIVHNPDQKNSTRIPVPRLSPLLPPAGYLLDQLFPAHVYLDDQGDVCDNDIDGDGQPNTTGGTGFFGLGAATRGALMQTAPADEPESGLDPYPYDTNNDGEDNDVDTDDDGDGVADDSDNCLLTPNPSQADQDVDGPGDDCDIDADGDTIHVLVETATGSDPLDSASKPEYAGPGDSCSNAADDDGDGLADAADPGCADADGDGFADSDDACPALADADNGDDDGDGVGDPCDVRVSVSPASDELLGSADPSTTVAFTATGAGPYQVRVGGTDCSTGALVASGSYDPGADGAGSEVVEIAAAELPEGTSTVRVCVTAAGQTGSDTTTVVRDLHAPVLAAPALTEASDTGSSASDGVTNAELLVLGGTTEPYAAIQVIEEDAVIGEAVADAAGEWAFPLAGPRVEGTYAFRLEGYDEAGNVSAPSPYGEIVVDRTAPVTTITAGPEADAGTAYGPVSFGFASSEPGTSECSVDGGEWAACASPHTVSLPPGSHTLGIRSTDVAGNREEPGTSRGWRVLFPFTGFFAPVDDQPTVNVTKAGSAVPMKFSLGGDRGLGILAAGSPSSARVDCATNAELNDVTETVTAGGSALTYDPATDRYQYVWKTDPAWSGSCRELRLVLSDGSVHRATFKFR